MKRIKLKGEIIIFDLILKNAEIITPDFTIRNGFIGIEQNKISYVGTEQEYKEKNTKFKSRNEIDLEGKYLVPGFFDIHTHGAAGIDYNKISSTEELEKASSLSAQEGVTSFLPTMQIASITEKFTHFISRLKDMENFIKKVDKGAVPFGINLELFMSPKIGCFSKIEGSEKVLPEPTVENWEKIKSAINKDTIKIVTVAPELNGGLELIRRLKIDNVIPSIGHSLASEEILEQAIRSGACLVTHILNALSLPDHPAQNELGVVKPGVNEYLLTRDNIMAEIIADHEGAHVHPTMMKLAVKCLGIDNIITITDSLHTRGTNISRFRDESGMEYICDGSVNRELNEGYLAGSAMSMNKVVASLIKHTGISINDAIKTATVNPAKLLNVFNCKGSIEVGKDADLAVIDEDINVLMTVVEGKIVYRKK